jgi:quinol monooxygenase YgiN
MDSRMSINEGKQAEFEKLAKEMSDLGRHSEVGTLKYEGFLIENENKYFIIETWDKWSSGLAQAREEAINTIFPEILKVAKVTHSEILW